MNCFWQQSRATGLRWGSNRCGIRTECRYWSQFEVTVTDVVEVKFQFSSIVPLYTKSCSQLILDDSIREFNRRTRLRLVPETFHSRVVSLPLTSLWKWWKWGRMSKRFVVVFSRVQCTNYARLGRQNQFVVFFYGQEDCVKFRGMDFRSNCCSSTSGIGHANCILYAEKLSRHS